MIKICKQKKTIRGAAALVLSCILIMAFMPVCSYGETAVEVDANPWFYGDEYPDVNYDEIEELTKYRYTDEITLESAHEYLEGFELAGTRTISTEYGEWDKTSPEAYVTIDGDVIIKHDVEKKKVHYSYAYHCYCRNIYYLYATGRHQDGCRDYPDHPETILDVDNGTKHVLRIYSENDPAKFQSVEDEDSPNFWCAKLPKVTSIENPGEFGEIYCMYDSNVKITEYVSYSPKEIAYVYSKKDKTAEDPLTTALYTIYRPVTTKYVNVFKGSETSEWSFDKPEEAEGRVIEEKTTYRYRDRVDQSIDCKDSYSKVYGCSAFNLNAKAKNDVSFKSSNKTVATVSSSGKVTVKNPGTATITVTADEGNGYKKAVKKVKVKVKMKTPVLTLKKKSSSSISLSWSKSAGANGYEIFKYNAKKKKYVKVATKSAKVKGTVNKSLIKGTHKYKVRSFRNVSGKKVYSSFSAVKKLKL